MRPSDAAARERALDPRTSFIIQAPAGSGKTELLVQRYLALLGVVENPEAIVAITFNKKAAAEMRSRVSEALARADEEPESEHQQVTRMLARAALARDRALDWQVLLNPSRMRIDTFDALCLRIAAQMPCMARLGSLPSPTEKPGDLYREAARRTIEMVDDTEISGALRTLLLLFDNDAAALIGHLAGMLEKREQWLNITGAGGADMRLVRQRLEASLEELVRESLARARRLMPDHRSADIARFGCRDTGCLPGTAHTDLDAWLAIAELLLTKEGGWRKRIDRNLGFLPQGRLTDSCKEFLKSLAGQHDEFRAALFAVRELPATRFDDAQWQTLCAVFQVLPRAAAELGVTFAHRNKVDFHALLFAALLALGDETQPTDLALALGCRIEHILVDEFQDTSRTQLRLLKKLTASWDAGGSQTLFLVGDPMQSIYRFRQAEVGIFLDARARGIGDVQLEPLALTENFRSQPEIVSWVNGVFGRILRDPEDVLSGAVRYAPFTAAATESGPRPTVHPFIGPQQRDEAELVVQLVRKARDEGGPTAILVRARSHLTAIIAALRRASIRFQAIEIHQLGERPIVQDLMALTFALLHPADRVSWLAVLRAPWCGLTLADLHAIASPNRYLPVWSLIDSALPNLSTDGRTRLARIRTPLDRALNERGRRTLRELVEGAWLLLDGPAFAASETDLEDAAAYFDLLETVDQGGDLANFAGLRDAVKELFAQPDVQADETVQVMTIHQAKGLEFDNVIVPGVGARSRSDDPPLLAVHEFGEESLLIAAKPESQDRLYKWITDQESTKAKNETKRLLYVAATRAKRALHLTGCARLTTTASGQAVAADSGSFLDLLWDDVHGEFEAELARRAGTRAVNQESEKPPRTIRRVSLDWRADAPPPAVSWEHEEEPAAEERPVTFEWAGDTLRHVGTVLHGWLQRIAVDGIASWDTARVRSLRNVSRAALAGLGVPPSELETATGTVLDALHNCLADDRARWMLSPHDEAECECALTGWLDGRYHRIRIDRTFINAGVRWLIDYKTSAHEGGRLDAFLANEKLRYSDQLERYARILSKIDPRPIRVALYFPLLSGWIEWEPLAMVHGAGS